MLKFFHKLFDKHDHHNGQLLGAIGKKDKKKIAGNVKKLIEYNEKVKELGVKDLYFVAASRNSWINRDKIGSSNYKDYTNEAWEDFFKDINSEIKTIDLRKKLEDINSTENIYYKTDHHWNSLGGYYAYREIINRLGNDYPEVGKAYELEEFDKEVVSKSFYGSYARRVGYLNVENPDQIVKYSLKGTPKIEVKIGKEKYSSLFFNEYIVKNKDYKEIYSNEYRYYSDGDKAMVRVNNLKNKNNLNVLVIKDSYMNVVTPFIVNHFQNTYIMDLRHWKSNAYDIIQSRKIDIVVFLYNPTSLTNNKQFDFNKKALTKKKHRKLL
ncbi:DHHW family protein [Psychrilyobacter sp.]|uniref:DHHW family protein n=1 Tax=Psychrilyobacter sp. TaxID=2586924 RepID=UPI00301AD1D3